MDLLSELAATRSGQGISQATLAARLGVPRLAVTRLEAGVGSVALLLRAMAMIELRISGVARGGTLPAQLRARRERLGLTIDVVAKRADLDPRTVEAVERGAGTVASLTALLTTIAPKAKKSEPPRASWSYDQSGHGERDKRFTPGWFLAHVVEAFGAVDLDPCAHEASSVEARTEFILPQCGLASSWSGHRLAYINPPYSGVSIWLERAADAWDAGEVATIVMLVPTRTDSAVFQDRVSRDADVLFLGGRMRFESTEGLRWPAPFALMLVVWGGDENSIQRFIELVPTVRMRPWR